MSALRQLMELDPHYQWLILATMLAIAEMIVPGVFLIWIAAAAALTGIVTLLLPIPVAAQFLLFASLSVGSAYLGRAWYRARGLTGGDALLNDRSARLVGQIVTVVETASSHAGRARVGDGQWPARGPGIPAGATARVTAVESGVLQLEPVEP